MTSRDMPHAHARMPNSLLTFPLSSSSTPLFSYTHGHDPMVAEPYPSWVAEYGPLPGLANARLLVPSLLARYLVLPEDEPLHGEGRRSPLAHPLVSLHELQTHAALGGRPLVGPEGEPGLVVVVREVGEEVVGGGDVEVGVEGEDEQPAGGVVGGVEAVLDAQALREGEEGGYEREEGRGDS